KSLLTCAITENHRAGVSKEYRPEGRELTAFSGDESTATEKIILIILNYFLENQTGFKLKSFIFNML
ncbi:hypothetical protein H1F46_004349, partial [Salmonella enterica]|nr:hypothetical protein [Salmonella enterica]